MSALFAGIPDWVVPFMILIVSVLALTIILERGWLLLKTITPLSMEDQKALLTLIKNGKFADAEAFCRLKDHPAYEQVLRIIMNRNDNYDLKHLADEEGLKQMAILEKYIPMLGTISTIGPLLGLLGTVTGMIKSFKAFDSTGAKSSAMMVGIDEALITTALGLVVAIPSLIMYNFYVRKINTIAEESNILVLMTLDEINRAKRK